MNFDDDVGPYAVQQMLDYLRKGLTKQETAQRFQVSLELVERVSRGEFNHLLTEVDLLRPEPEPRSVELPRRRGQQPCKLSDRQVMDVLEQIMAGNSYMELARQHGVCQATVQSIATGKTYKHVPRPPGFKPLSRSQPGSRNPMTKLKEGDVKQIIQMLHRGAGLTETAQHFGVAATTVELIRQGRTWKHVPRPTGFKTNYGGFAVRRLTSEQVWQIKLDFIDGMSVKGIAKKYGTNQSGVRLILDGQTFKDVGDPPGFRDAQLKRCQRNEAWRKKKQRIKDQAPAMHRDWLKNDMSFAEIAEKYGFSRATVSRVVQEFDRHSQHETEGEAGPS